MAARARFFASLPANDLTPMEHGLRKALLKAAETCNDRPFPLEKWIHFRIGGEVGLRQDEDGSVEIFMRGANPPPVDDNREAFLSTLPADWFTPAEKGLRDAIFEFLATWRSQELATIQHLENDPNVQRQCGFLPWNVPLRDWVLRRIGGEIGFRPGGHGRPEVVHLNDTARETVMAKLAQLQQSGMQPPPPPHMGFGGPPPPMMHMGHPPPPMGHSPPSPGYGMRERSDGAALLVEGPPPPHHGGPAAVSAAAAAPAATNHARAAVTSDEFFAKLPMEELLPGELALREALLAWIDRWPQNRRNTRGPDSPPHISDTGAELAICRACRDLLPKSVKLEKWIGRRIGGEIELRTVANGEIEVYLRGTAPPEAPQSRGGRGGGGGSGGGGGNASVDKKETLGAADDFTFGDVPRQAGAQSTTPPLDAGTGGAASPPRRRPEQLRSSPPHPAWTPPTLEDSLGNTIELFLRRRSA